MKKKFLFALLSLVLVLVCAFGFAACGLFGGVSGSNGGGSSDISGGGSSSSDDENLPKVDTDGTFIYTGASVKAANTSISGEIVIPSEHNGTTIDTIPANAFKGCTGITSIVIPDSVTSIGLGAFNGCSMLKSITLPFVGSRKGNSGSKEASFGYVFGESSYQGGTKVEQYYGGGTSNWSWFFIPSTLRSVKITNETVINYGAFQNCSMLTKIDLNDGIVQVGTISFANCERVEEVSLPSISIIPSSLFKGCSSLSKFTINDSVETIGANAFAGCGALSSVNSETAGEFVIPDSVTSIGSGVFNGCYLLKSITLPFVGSKKGNSGSKEANFGYIFGEDSYQGGTKVKQYYGSGVTSWNWFFVPTALRTVKITNETVIGYGAFQNCSMLTSITINAGAKNNVGAKAFENTVNPTWI